MSEGKTVLLVEDDQFISTFLEAKLREQFAVKLAATTKGAGEVLAAGKVDLILLDILLPEEGGFAFLKRIKKENSPYREIPVVILSNLDRPDDIEQAKKLGAVDYLVKGNFVPADVARKVSEILGVA